MTFEEARSLLNSLRAKKRRVQAIRNRITELNSDAGMLQSSLGGDGMPHGTDIRDSTAQLALRIAEMRERFEAALDECFAIEDRLAETVNTLSDDEQYIIIECYMSGKSIWKVSEEMGYCDRTVKRKKRQAIEKIAKML